MGSRYFLGALRLYSMSYVFLMLRDYCNVVCWIISFGGFYNHVRISSSFPRMSIRVGGYILIFWIFLGVFNSIMYFVN